MPRNPKYPLAPLREHRDRRVEHATAQLGDAVRAREAADKAKLRTEQERAEAAARAANVRSEEANHLLSGELRVADLARAQAWEYGASLEMAERERAIDLAASRLVAAGELETGARAELAQTKADRDVVAKDEARFDAGVRRDREANDEEAADEVVAARRRQG